MFYQYQSSHIEPDFIRKPFASRLRHRKRRLYNGSLPAPLGLAPTYNFEVCGLRIHDDTCFQRWTQKSFTRYQYWWLEMSDELFRKICPADLLDLPCPFRGSQTRVDSCKHLRLCSIYHKWDLRSEGCPGELCPYLHEISPTCRSLQKQIAGSEFEPARQFCAYQTCKFVAGVGGLLADDSYCDWGHDFEGARIEATWNYFNHFYQAQRAGCHHTDEQRDADGQKMWKPKVPDIRTLSQLKYDASGASVTGLTFHNHRVTIPIELYKGYVQRVEARILEDSSLEHTHDTHHIESGQRLSTFQNGTVDRDGPQQIRDTSERRMSAPAWSEVPEGLTHLACVKPLEAEVSHKLMVSL